MTDDLVPDWRIQASFKFGADNYPPHMLNVRADDVSELGEILESIDGTLVDKLSNVSASLGVTTVVAAAAGPVTQVPSQESRTASSNVPVCAHGERTYYNGGKWEAFFCPQPKNAKSKCDPIFKGDDNKHEAWWPAA